VQPFDLVKVESLKCKLVTWKSSFAKDARIATKQKMEIQRKNKISPEDILAFEASSIVRSTIKQMNFAIEGKQVKATQTLSSIARDLLPR